MQNAVDQFMEMMEPAIGQVLAVIGEWMDKLLIVIEVLLQFKK